MLIKGFNLACCSAAVFIKYTHTHSRLSPQPLLKTVRPASDLDAEQLPLWQIQVAGSAKRDFANRVVTGAREALLDHPNEEARNLKAFERVKRVRLVSGQVNPREEADLDQVGVQAWNPAIYAAGEDASEGLCFIHFVLEQKVAKKELHALPRLAVQMLEGVDFEPPAPWTRMLQAEPLVKAFEVVPPRGKRHILAQLEIIQGSGGPAKADSQAEESQAAEAQDGQSEEEEEEEGEPAKESTKRGKYIFSVFGGMYIYKDRFEASGISGAQVQLENDKTEYLRMAEFATLEEGKTVLKKILEDCLMGNPIYFINNVGAKDEAHRVR